MIELFICPMCGGDGVETCNNPDHGFIDGVGGEISRLGCPGCGSHPEHKIPGYECPECEGCGMVTKFKGLMISMEYNIDEELEERRNLKKLDLVLTTKWFNMIEQGIKEEEYRDITDFWCRRLFDYEKATEDDLAFKEFDVVVFRLGYQRTAKRMVVAFKGMEFGKGKPEWGGSEHTVFKIKLGTIFQRINF